MKCITQQHHSATLSSTSGHVSCRLPFGDLVASEWKLAAVVQYNVCNRCNQPAAVLYARPPHLEAGGRAGGRGGGGVRDRVPASKPPLVQKCAVPQHRKAVVAGHSSRKLLGPPPFMPPSRPNAPQSGYNGCNNAASHAQTCGGPGCPEAECRRFGRGVLPEGP